MQVGAGLIVSGIYSLHMYQGLRDRNNLEALEIEKEFNLQMTSMLYQKVSNGLFGLHFFSLISCDNLGITGRDVGIFSPPLQ